jgi:hypothetical protein
MYVKRNIEVRSRNHCCRGKGCLCAWVRAYVGARARRRVHTRARVPLLIQHATRMRHIACGLSGSTIFRHYLINGTIFEKKKKKC